LDLILVDLYDNGNRMDLKYDDNSGGASKTLTLAYFPNSPKPVKLKLIISTSPEKTKDLSTHTRNACSAT